MRISDIEEEILSLWDSGEYGSMTALAKFVFNSYKSKLEISEASARKMINRMINIRDCDKEIIAENVKYKRETQKTRDKLRIENKAFREPARLVNALESLGESLLNAYKKHGERLAEKVDISKLATIGVGGVGIMQVSDVHFNELIALPHNQYNFTIASKRLKKHTQLSIDYFKFKKVRKVIIAYTGDLLNSDRRLDEMLNQDTNRALASSLSAHIIVQQILHVRDAGYEVEVVSVLGNESRSKPEMAFSNNVFSDNYDFTIMAQVRHVLEFSKIKGINFISIDQMETVLNIDGMNFLFLHGINLLKGGQRDIQSLMGRYSQQGITIHYIVYGHGHSTKVTDLCCQSSSVCGANAYSDHSLGLAGRAAQICMVVFEREISIQYNDLQYYDNDGYETISEMEKYNIKSADKNRQEVTTFKIVI